jgi:hypothetical protein
MKLNEVIEEMLGAPGGKQYPAYNEPPRKDFVPYSNKAGYNYPYQQNTSATPTPENVIPPHIPSIPWPLEGVTEDLSDSYIYLLTAGNKINQALKSNPSLSDNQRKHLKEYLKRCKTALDIIKSIGVNLINKAELN